MGVSDFRHSRRHGNVRNIRLHLWGVKCGESHGETVLFTVLFTCLVMDKYQFWDKASQMNKVTRVEEVGTVT